MSRFELMRSDCSVCRYMYWPARKHTPDKETPRNREPPEHREWGWAAAYAGLTSIHLDRRYRVRCRSRRYRTFVADGPRESKRHRYRNTEPRQCRKDRAETYPAGTKGTEVKGSSQRAVSFEQTKTLRTTLPKAVRPPPVPHTAMCASRLLKQSLTREIPFKQKHYT